MWLQRATRLTCLLFNPSHSFEYLRHESLRLHLMTSQAIHLIHTLLTRLINETIRLFQLKYTVDPAYMQPGEKKSFSQYLHEQRMYIDVWDGNSLMLIGSTSVELKVCRKFSLFCLFQVVSRY